MALTKAQIRNRAANLLGILPFGQALQSQDSDRIEQAYDEVFEYLKEMGLATWASTGSVPNNLATHVIAMVAHNCLDDYGVSNDRFSRILNRYGVAEKEIRKIIVVPYSSQTPPRDF